MSSETEETAMASLGMKKRKKSQSSMIMTTSAVSSLDSSASQLHTHENVYFSRKIINKNKLDVPNNKSVQVEEESFIIEKRKSNNRARARARARRGGKNRAVVLSPYFANQTTRSNEIDLGFNGNAKGRRKDSRRYTQQDLEDEDHKMESDYSPLKGSLQNEILKLEDLLSQCTYKTKNDGGRNLAAEVENEAVMLPSIYANLKEDQLQQIGLQIEKQQAIARVDVRKVSLYFANEGGPKFEETIRNKNSIISKHSRGDSDPRKDKKRGKRKDDRISKECTKSNEIRGFEKAVLIDEDVGLTEGFDGNAKGRRKDSRHYTWDFHKMVVKNEEKDVRF